MSLPTYALAALHGFFGFTHLNDPAAAVVEMTGASSTSPTTEHAIAIIGSLHLFVALILVMAAAQSDLGHRKCILGIYLISWPPAAIYTQFKYPATGTPPGPMDMPMPVLYAVMALSLLGIVLSGSAKTKTS